MKMPFGKYKGFLLEDLAILDSEYILWVSKNVNFKEQSLNDKIKEIVYLRENESEEEIGLSEEDFY